jgi:CheY-like chemotaxis protein
MAEPTQGIILNVDDNEALRYTKTRVVRAAGFTVYEAGSGQEALRRLREVIRIWFCSMSGCRIWMGGNRPRDQSGSGAW